MSTHRVTSSQSAMESGPISLRVPDYFSRRRDPTESSCQTVKPTSAMLTSKQRRYHFARLIHRDPPALPQSIVSQIYPAQSSPSNNVGKLRLGSHSQTDKGKVKVVICVNQSNFVFGPIQPTACKEATGGQNTCLMVDQNRNHISLIDPDSSAVRRRSGLSKTYSFNSILTRTDGMAKLCVVALIDALHAVVRGQDSCVLSIGHRGTGKTYSMIGSDDASTSCGIIPCAISWLYQLLNQCKQSNGDHFSIRISAVEIYDTSEEFHDLLADVIEPPAEPIIRSQCVRDSVDKDYATMAHPQVANRMQELINSQCEVRATSAEKAARLLDMALSNRWISRSSTTMGLSHMLVTLHVYKCRSMERDDTCTDVPSGRTRLHLLDLGCGRYAYHTSDSAAQSPLVKRSGSLKEYTSTKPLSPLVYNTNKIPTSKCLSISGISNVLLALLTGQRQLPFRDSALTHLLKEALTGNQINPCIVAHVSCGAQYHSETSQVLQLVSKLNRLKRRKVGSTMTSGSMWSTSDYLSKCDETGSSSLGCPSDNGSCHSGHRRRRGPRLGRSSFSNSISRSFASDLDFSSSSEQSCDTVIYLGQNDGHTIYKLGPRGAADGSVDVFSISSDQLSPNESSSMAINKLDNQPNQSSCSERSSINHRLVKRIMPRTNASVWPRHLSLRKVQRSLINHDAKVELWVDGPNVGHSQRGKQGHLINDAIPYNGESHDQLAIGTHKIINSAKVGVENFPEHGAPLQYPENNKNIWESQQQHNDDFDATENQVQRALSDISEHTEETETATDCHTVKSLSAIDPLDCLSLFNLESLPYPSKLLSFPSHNSIQHCNVSTESHVGSPMTPRTVTSLCTTVEDSWKTSRELSRFQDTEQNHTPPSTDDTINEENLNGKLADLTSPCRLPSSAELGYSPLKSLKKKTHLEVHHIELGSEHGNRMNVRSEQVLQGNLNNSACMDSPILLNIEAPKTKANSPRFSSQLKGTHLQRFNPTPNSTDQSSSKFVTANRSLSRVAAWVDSVNSLQLTKHSPMDRYRESTKVPTPSCIGPTENIPYIGMTDRGNMPPASHYEFSRGYMSQYHRLSINSPQLCIAPQTSTVVSQLPHHTNLVFSTSSPNSPMLTRSSEHYCFIQPSLLPSYNGNTPCPPLDMNPNQTTYNVLEKTNPLSSFPLPIDPAIHQIRRHSDQLPPLVGSTFKEYPPKPSKYSKAFRFLTLPIFRSLLWRKNKKSPVKITPLNSAQFSQKASRDPPILPQTPFKRLQKPNEDQWCRSLSRTATNESTSWTPNTPISNCFDYSVDGPVQAHFPIQHKPIQINSCKYRPGQDQTLDANFYVPRSIPNFSYTALQQNQNVIPRSTRRSIGGGPASSGYESMRIGTSDLSLSHPDSESDCCSTAFGNKLLMSNEKIKAHRNTDASRIHISSPTSYGSPLSNSLGSISSNRNSLSRHCANVLSLGLKTNTQKNKKDWNCNPDSNQHTFTTPVQQKQLIVNHGNLVSSFIPSAAAGC